jgi:pyruvate/2-oxoglutarate dehydrogenase complex dihydrolipoamide acyltransferase (E2) component
VEPAVSTEIILPKLGFSVNEALLAEWMVGDGDTVVAGQNLYAIESEKSVEEIEAPGTGVLKILLPAGETYEVGTVIGEIS